MRCLFLLLAVASCASLALAQSAQPSPPAPASAAPQDQAAKQFADLLHVEASHLQQTRVAIEASLAAKSDASVQAGLAIAQRFIDRVSQPEPKQSREWSILQLQEVEQVLDNLDHRIDGTLLLSAPTTRPAVTLMPTTQPGGVFTVGPTAAAQRPYFYYGYGHFSQVYNDLSLWKQIGVSLVQDGRVGPSGMNENGTLRDNAKQMLADLDSAAQAGVKVDYLLSPHYFPEWAQRKARRGSIAGGLGFLSYNIDHPVARDAVGRFADIITKQMQGKPALFSVCLSNEPTYDDSGRNPQSLVLYQQYVRDVHKTLRNVNAVYGTNYKYFSQIKPPPPALSGDLNQNRAFFDWCSFNNKHFADWHAWLGGIVKKNLPNVPTHTKIMVFFSMDRDKLGWGVDPERMCDATDLAGCDAYAMPDPDLRSFQWHGHAFWYDLLHSFRGQPVFDSENHIIGDNTGPIHLPMEMTYSQFWQGALHHQAATTAWVWEEPLNPSLAGSIFLRPANIFGATRAMIDINRLALELAAVNAATARVALLYSPASIFWEAQYQSTIYNSYTYLDMLGEPITFVSDRMLAEGGERVPKVQWIIVPQASHVPDSTVTALQKFVAGGGNVMVVGEKNLTFDEYHRARAAVPAELQNAPTFTIGSDQPTNTQQLTALLTAGGTTPIKLLDSTNAPPWPVEFRVVPYKGGLLVPMTSFAKSVLTLHLPDFAGRTATELITGRPADLQHIELAPMRPKLIYIEIAK